MLCCARWSTTRRPRPPAVAPRPLRRTLHAFRPTSPHGSPQRRPRHRRLAGPVWRRRRHAGWWPQRHLPQKGLRPWAQVGRWTARRPHCTPQGPPPQRLATPCDRLGSPRRARAAGLGPLRAPTGLTPGLTIRRPGPLAIVPRLCRTPHVPKWLRGGRARQRQAPRASQRQAAQQFSSSVPWRAGVACASADRARSRAIPSSTPASPSDTVGTAETTAHRPRASSQGRGASTRSRTTATNGTSRAAGSSAGRASQACGGIVISRPSSGPSSGTCKQ